MADTHPMQGRWLREATEKQIRTLTKNHSSEAKIVEWNWAGQSYWLFKRHGVIIRSNILGGGVVDIHGGWFYADQISLLLDWAEIEKMGNVGFLDRTS